MYFSIGKKPGTGPTPQKFRADGHPRIRKSLLTGQIRQEYTRGSGKEFADFIRNRDKQNEESTIRRHKEHQKRVTLGTENPYK